MKNTKLWRASGGEIKPVKGIGVIARMTNYPEAVEDSHLMAAAPEMYDVLKWILTIPANEPGRIVCFVNKISAAIAKAEGQTL